MKIKIKLCSCKAEFIDLCSFFQQIKEDDAFHFVFVENKNDFEKESYISIMRKPYNHGDLEVVKEIITRKFIITQNNNDYWISCLLNEDGKEYDTAKNITSLIKLWRSKKTLNIQSNLFLLYKDEIAKPIVSFHTQQYTVTLVIANSQIQIRCCQKHFMSFGYYRSLKLNVLVLVLPNFFFGYAVLI